MKKEHEEIIEKFVGDYEFLLAELRTYAGYLQLGEEGERAKNEAIAVLEKKLKKMKKAENKKELKKVLKVNKLIEREEE